MGLFDIFRRRSKESKEEKQPEETVKSSEQSEQETKLESVTDAQTTAADANETEAENTATEATTDSTSTDDQSDVKENEEAEKPVMNDSEESDSSFDSSEETNESSTEESDNSQATETVSEGDNLEDVSDDSAVEDTREKTTTRQDTQSETIANTDSETITNNLETETAASQEDTNESEESPVEEPTSVDNQSTEPDDTQKFDDTKQPTEDGATQYEHGLAKSRSTFGQRLNALFANFRSVDEEFFERLEDMLIESDVGFETAMKLTDELRDEVKLQNAKKPKDVQNVIVQKMIELYDSEGNGEDNTLHLASSGPTVLLFVGVNGVGKTTTIGKLAKRFKDEGKKVLLVAADTFRAGAIEQLNVWAQRDGVDIVKKEAGSDPAASVFDGVKKAKAENYDILMVDTAGRLQNKVNLMNELAKMKKILTREIPDAPHEVLLVLDATTGQNAMTQAKTFKDTTDVTGIVLTKLDGTAKGGIVLAIRNELHLPVKLVGLGEKVTDLADFDANNFIYGLFKGLFKD
ncbi:signal recognition particle-docking protein FtsY [Lentilactobacillus sp. SPB1-3]|uniref:Signal recognition particle-docking protein FtsY n=1 Tax=Lentilactobacillus terminaliae TaxID=3003483 RepID=A0ACD5DBY5_9LACO|nr:signal recognition particle-docking protein FtsY [Lentilactobacillus sp. SPB1-3]MCZ0977182.1 signal recognition particle-docking protein FtsY [Lentilactobacillus sp. SPB1-3]